MTSTGNPIEAVRARLDGGRKWHKGSWNDINNEHVCILGALAEIHNTHDVTAEETVLDRIVLEQYEDRIEDRRRQRCDQRVRVVPAFNDHPDTTWADVETVLDKASIAWDARVSP